LNEILNKKLSSCENVNIVQSDVDCVSTCVNAVVTRSQTACKPVIPDNDCDTSDVSESCDNDVMNHDSDETFIDVDEPIINIRSDIGVSNASDFTREQQADPSLSSTWALANQNKAGYFVKNELLFHKVKRFGQTLELLVIPTSRREAVMRLAHADSHFSARRTKERIITSGLFLGKSHA